MNEKNLSTSRLLKVAACFIFDIAVIIAFFKIFSLYSLLAPVKSTLMLLVLLMGLFLINAAIVFPSILFKSISIPYMVSISVSTIIYALAANLLSIVLIAGNITWYIIWELLLLAGYITIISVLSFFSKRTSDQHRANSKETIEKQAIQVQLSKIEIQISEHADKAASCTIMRYFKSLKERINFSTPFGRITDNNNVLELEAEIQNNLVELATKTVIELNDTNTANIIDIINKTKLLVIEREKANIR